MTRFLTAAFLAAIATPGWAIDFNSAVQAYYEKEIATWANDPVLISAVEAQNMTTSGYSAAKITALDTAWRNEIGASDTPTISPVITGSAADFLRERVAAAGGTITEVFIMDAQGLNVAASGLTSDYWQGDEAKFSETYPQGAGALHVSEVEFDDSTQTYQTQISVTLVDATGKPVGAMTVGVNADSLM